MEMTMEFIRGDLLGADTEAIVNAVNCVGVMGRGLAEQFKRRFPDNFRAYKAACASGEVMPGQMFVFATGMLENPRLIVNFPTKRHWREDSRMEDIDAGLVALVREVKERGVSSLALPALGCGLGGLDWREVRPCIERAFAPLTNVRVVVYEPGDQGVPRSPRGRLPPRAG